MPKLIGLVSLGLIAYVTFGPVFSLKQILCQVNTDPCPPQLLDKLNQLQGKNLLFFRLEPLRQELTQSPVYSQVNLTVILPHTLRVELIVSQSVSVQLLEALKQAYLSASSVTTIDSTTLEASLSADITARFTTLKDFPSQVSSLQLILNLATIDPKPRLIDVRFDKPILSY